jgi:exosome complex component RRP4
MNELIVNNKDIVVPGDILAEGMEFLPGTGTYRLGDKIRAQGVGLAIVDRKVIRLVPLAGRYIPKKGDTIIGYVVDILMSGWRIELGSAYQAVLPLQEASTEYIEKGSNLRQYFDFNEYICAKITQVTSQKLIDISLKGPGLKKLYGGRVVKINPYKVPRLIGKQGSMVSLIKQYTGSMIIVGQNGVTWVKNDDVEKEIITIETIKKIEENAHISGLTDKIKAYLSEIIPNPPPQQEKREYNNEKKDYEYPEDR